LNVRTRSIREQIFQTETFVNWINRFTEKVYSKYTNETIQ